MCVCRLSVIIVTDRTSARRASDNMPSISLYEAIEEAVIEHVMQVAAGDAGPHSCLCRFRPTKLFHSSPTMLQASVSLLGEAC